MILEGGYVEVFRQLDAIGLIDGEGLFWVFHGDLVVLSNSESVGEFEDIFVGFVVLCLGFVIHNEEYKVINICYRISLEIHISDNCSYFKINYVWQQSIHLFKSLHE